MLAYPVSNKPIDYNKPVFMQPKLDGVRCIIQYEKGFNPNLDPSFDDRDKLVANVRLDSYFFNMLRSKSKLLFLSDFNAFSPKALNEFSPDITKFFLFNKFLVNLNFIFSIDLSMTISSIGRDTLFLEKGLI